MTISGGASNIQYCVQGRHARRHAYAQAARKRNGGVTTTQGSGKRSRGTSIGSTDEYEEATCLGEGGFSAVLKAGHRVTGKTVAIKRLSSPDVAELLREARFLETCSGNPYVVGFEGLVAGAPPDHRRPLPRHGVRRRAEPPRLPVGQVPRPAAPGIDGARLHVEAADRGQDDARPPRLVHRDIKPASILVGQGGELLKICDLGMAISMSDSPPYIQAGTVPYMAPEMLPQKPDYDALVDTWSLGCVMAEMLTGETLFDDDDDDDDHQDEFNETDHTVQLWNIFPGSRHARRPDMAVVHVPAAHRQGAATATGGAQAQHAAGYLPSREAVRARIPGVARASHVQSRQATHGGQGAQAPMVRCSSSLRHRRRCKG